LVTTPATTTAAAAMRAINPMMTIMSVPPITLRNVSL
jgi:hypothetical protein